jgi:hypothetical protein
MTPTLRRVWGLEIVFREQTYGKQQNQIGDPAKRYEIRPRKDRRGFDLPEGLPFTIPARCD